MGSLKLFSFLVGLLMVIGCVQQTDNNKPADAMPGKEQSIEKPTFGISPEDIQYIDLIVPEYAEVVLYHEKASETTAFAKQLISYFYSNHASVEIHPVNVIQDKKHPISRNFSIDFIGDHRYIVRVFDVGH